MQLDISENSLPIYSALANPVRLEILRLLSGQEMNITQLAEKLHLSKTIITKHIQQLEGARLIKTQKRPGHSGTQKLSQLAVDTINITFPAKIYHSYQVYVTEVKLGHYSDFSVCPTCGLATPGAVVGKLDDPLAFVMPQRVDTALLWFSTGHISYKIPCFLTKGQEPQMLELSFEIASEFPISNNIWPSDISFYLGSTKLGVWTCPGNFSDVRGFYTPSWWEDSLSQYGLLKHLRVTQDGTHMDGDLLSPVKLEDLALQNQQFLDFRIEIEPKAEHAGGVTLFGRGFGNHDQDILVKLYYSVLPGASEEK